MIAARLSQIAQALDPRLIKGDADFLGVSTDSRSIAPGELFVALRGERFDGHLFIDDARERGAAAVLVEHEVEADLPQLVVIDTQDALGDLARWARGHSAARVIAITGSNGKTTVKTLTHSILARCGSCHVNAGNFNNEIGLPLSVLRMPEHAQFAVLEMGAGKPGDIAYLADIARPAISIVNNVAPAHLERMRTLDGIAQTKGAIYTALPADGVAVINADDAFADVFRSLAGARRIVSFGLERSADVRARVASSIVGNVLELITPLGEVEVRLPLAGRHNAMNALAATALAYAAGASLDAIAAGLQNAPTVAGRLTRHQLPDRITVIDDSYNANPGSTAAAIETLALETGERWLVLGNMAELGSHAEQLHADIGGHAKRAGIEHLYTVGSFSAASSKAFGVGAQHFSNHADANAQLLRDLRPGVTVLVKGSRSSAMERVVQALLDRYGVDRGAGHAA